MKHFAVLAAKRSQGAGLRLVCQHLRTLVELKTILASYFNTHTAFQLVVLRWLNIEVTLQLTKLSSPLAAFLMVATEYLEARERSLETLVGEVIKMVTLTARAWLIVSLDPFNAGLAVAVATAGDLVGLTENQ